jgi:hypothetical protein
LVALFAPHELLLAVLLDGEAVDQFHRLRVLDQMACQVLKVVAGRLHAHQHHLRLGASPGLGNRLTQLIEPALVDVHIKWLYHDLTQTIVDHRHMKILADVQGDAQDLFGGNPSNEFGKSLTALTA